MNPKSYSSEDCIALAVDLLRCYLRKQQELTYAAPSVHISNQFDLIQKDSCNSVNNIVIH